MRCLRYADVGRFNDGADIGPVADLHEGLRLDFSAEPARYREGFGRELAWFDDGFPVDGDVRGGSDRSGIAALYEEAIVGDQIAFHRNVRAQFRRMQQRFLFSL